MLYLADTNILLRFVAPTDPNHALVRHILYSLLKRGELICYLSQNLERHLTFLPDSEEIHTQWRNLIVDHRVCGVQVHDARIVAAMRVYNITQILSFNTDDFIRYSNEIQAIHPSEIGSELNF
jgi:predicted nucleic acid-binding protein